jgi:succinoglycan biosynthesis protein ExoM
MEMITRPEDAFRIAAPGRDTLLAVCVCTYGRPKSLRDCLASLSRQQPVDKVRHFVIVIDNDATCSAMPVVSASRSGAFYIAEPRRGIAYARNRGLSLAARLEADWIAFIDDDEIADDQWLRGLMAPEYSSVPILRGHRILCLPVPSPFWATQVKEKPPVEGAECHTAYTHNVRFSRALADQGLRFDEAFAFSGGEDVDFFTRAHKCGFEIRQTARAVTYETIHSERLTYTRQCAKSFWTAAANMREAILRKGLAKALSAKLHTIPLNLVLGPALIAGSPLALALGLEAFKRTALVGGDKLARAMGRLAAIVGYLPAPYLRVDGE